jgi:hypothetical protein
MASAGIPPRPADSKGKSWVFKTPPGWPVPPDGWEPPDGWSPKPSWPPPPAGWEFWSLAPGRKRPGLSFYVKATAGILSLAATIAGTYFAFRSQPQSPTTAGWVTQANAACDRDIGSLKMSLFEGSLPAGDQTAGQNASAGQQKASRLGDMIAVEGALSKINGDLAALPIPGDSRAPAVQAALRAGTALVTSLDTYSDAAQAVIDNSGTASAAQLAAETQNENAVLSSEFTWQKAIAALGLTQCPFWTAHPPSAAPTVTPQAAPATTPPAAPSASLTAAEQQLAGRLSSSDLTDCVGRPDQEINGIVAAVNCQSAQFGPTKSPLVVQFADAAAAQSWFQGNTTGFVDDDDCADGRQLGTWNHTGFFEGPWGCGYLGNGDFRIISVANTPLVGLIADGSNGSIMYSWWKNWGYVLSDDG